MDFISSDKENLKKALKQQQNEINDYTIYKALSLFQKNEEKQFARSPRRCWTYGVLRWHSFLIRGKLGVL